MELSIVSSTSSTFLAPLYLSRPSKHASRSFSYSFSPSAIQAEDKPRAQFQEQHVLTVATTVQNSSAKQGSVAAKATSWPAFLCNALDDMINKFMDPPARRPAVDPHRVLIDNFAPVDELPPTACPIIWGAIPHCLAGGVYIRNGPNPQHFPRGPYHLFDGDGMLHSILLPSSDDKGLAMYSSRYVRTYRYCLEQSAGVAVVPNIFASFHGLAGVARLATSVARTITGQWNPINGVGLANTSLAYFGQCLYALGESDLPYKLSVSPKDGDVVTVGRADFNGKLSMMSMTAHPKVDKSTGETFAFCYGLVSPFLTFFRFDAHGNKVGADVPVSSLQTPSFVHDFAITRKYVVFADIQIVMKPMNMVTGNGPLIVTDASKVPRIGVLPRYADSEKDIKWFDVPGFNPVHMVNAWDEGNELVIIAPNVLTTEHLLERIELLNSRMEMVRINLSNGDVTARTALAPYNLDFGAINPAYLGRKNRYAYLGVGNPAPKISSVVKLDIDLVGKGDCVVARREFGAGRFGGEPFYIAKGERPDEEEEDDGYLVSYVHDEKNGESSFVVMDAKSSELEVVAEVVLPRRVPYGFHGIFLTAEELMAQGSK